MKKILFFIVIFSIASVSFIETDNNNVKIKKIKIHAPFRMPAICYPDFSGCPKFSIVDFGAIPGNLQKTKDAIEKAINKANQVNGGTVIIPSGEWLTGTIHLKSNVNLHLEKGAVLLFSDDPNDYLPAVHTTWEGMECYNYSPLIYAYENENIAITGQGRLEAKMEFWTKWFARPSGHMQSLKRLYLMSSNYSPVEERQMVNDTANMRPQFIQFNRCKNVLMEGVSVRNSPFWTIHPYLSRNVVIRNIHVVAHGHNNDGVDPEMSQNLLIENCVFDQGDDAIAIKSGRNQDAWRLHTPSKNIVIRNITVKNGFQLAALGSELSGGIENVFINNCVLGDDSKVSHLLFIKTNERRGGYVKNIYVENISAGIIEQGVLGIETNVLYQWKDLVPTIDRKLTPISDIHFKNIHATQVRYISRILGQAELPVKNIALKNVKVDTILEQKYISENTQNFKAN